MRLYVYVIFTCNCNLHVLIHVIFIINPATRFYLYFYIIHVEYAKIFKIKFVAQT